MCKDEDKRGNTKPSVIDIKEFNQFHEETMKGFIFLKRFIEISQDEFQEKISHG